MKLNHASIERALDQIEGQAIPDDHPAVSQLYSLFGDHTFFLGAGGLKIVEPIKSTDSATRKAMVIKLADWADQSRTSLVPHPPEATDEVVTLEGADQG
ncbi:MAG: hypothetical protein R3D62_14160 [Xanthobacteraceae bacterium]